MKQSSVDLGAPRTREQVSTRGSGTADAVASFTTNAGMNMGVGREGSSRGSGNP
jgi:hypothetical protein